MNLEGCLRVPPACYQSHYLKVQKPSPSLVAGEGEARDARVRVLLPAGTAAKVRSLHLRGNGMHRGCVDAAEPAGHPFYSHPEAGVRDRAVAAQIQVPFEGPSGRLCDRILLRSVS